jgi:hypothetical protein
MKTHLRSKLQGLIGGLGWRLKREIDHVAEAVASDAFAGGEGEREGGREGEKERGRESREEHSLDVISLGVNAKEMSRRTEQTSPALSAQRQGGGTDGAVPPSLPRSNKQRGMKLGACAAPVRRRDAA